MEKTISKEEILKLLKTEKEFLNKEFGVLKIGLFGSYARNQQESNSDIDFLVELSEPKFEWLAGLQVYMEDKFNRKVELVRKNGSGSRFLKNVEKEVIYA